MKYSMSSLFLAGVIATFALTAGCTSPEPAQAPRTPQLPDPGADQEYEVKFPEEGGGATRYIRLAIGDDLSESCGLVRAHFEFDSSEPLPQDEIGLRAVSTCLNLPEMVDQKIVIVGRADTRGNEAYNVELGRKRANSVKSLLVQAGVAADRITTTSIGKTGAVGDDKGLYSFGYDRRVDVLINAASHRPR
jgi:outer membrane protein OmpA-like peptidoglycan-associated protein